MAQDVEAALVDEIASGGPRRASGANGETREALLDAGVALFTESSDRILRGFTAAAVAERAGFHRQTFYRYWGTQADYVDDLIRHLFAPAPPVADGAAAMPDWVCSRDPETFIRDLAHHDYCCIANQPVVPMQVGLLLMGALNGPAMAAQTQAYFDASLRALSEAYGHLLAGWGLELVEPVTCDDLARVFQGLMLGLVLQDKAALHERHGSELFEWAAVAFLCSVTRRSGPTASSPDRPARPVGTAPAVGGGRGETRPSVGGTEKQPAQGAVASTRRTLLEAGLCLFTESSEQLLRGFTAGAVAERAGYHRQTFYRYWDTQAAYVEDLIDHLFSPVSPLTDGAVAAPDWMSSPDPVAFLHRVAEHDHRRLTEGHRVHMQIGLLTMGLLGRPGVAEKTQAYYEAALGGLRTAYEALLDQWGLELIAPLSSSDLVRMLQALLVGLVIQDMAADNERHGSEVFVLAGSAIVGYWTRPVDA